MAILPEIYFQKEHGVTLGIGKTRLKHPNFRDFETQRFLLTKPHHYRERTLPPASGRKARA